MYNKYRNVKVSHAGYSFSSKLEAELFDMLKLMELGKLLSDIKVQQHIYLTRARIQYIADFSVIDSKTEEMVYYEAKGFPTPEWKIKKRLYAFYGPAPLHIYYGKNKKIERIDPICVTSSESDTYEET